MRRGRSNKPATPEKAGTRAPVPAANLPSARDKTRKRPLRNWAMVSVLGLLVLGGGGYLVGKQLWGLHHWRQAQRALDDRDYPLALEKLDRCLEIWPNDAKTHFFLARSYRLSGNRAKARVHLNVSKDAAGDAELIALEFQLLDADTGKLEGVENALRQHIQAGHPEKRYVYESLIRGYLIRQRNDEAERLATAWLGESPDDWQPWLLRAMARTQRAGLLVFSSFDDTKEDYKRVLELKPDHDVARLLLANAYVRSGQFREALPHLVRYCQLKPDDWQGIVELAGCHRALGQAEEARQTIDDWLPGHTGTVELFSLRGEVAVDQAKPEDALGYLRKAEALAPTHPKTHYLLAQALRSLGRTEEAGDYEKKWRAHEELTRNLKILEQLAAKEPQNVAARFDAGVIALRLGNDASGVQWLNSALQLDPNHRPSHEALANHFERKGNYPAAASHRRLAAGTPPN